jgi:hypothetical protein
VERFWTVRVFPRRRRFRRAARRAADAALVARTVAHLAGVLDRHEDVPGVRWMTDAEAAATDP